MARITVINQPWDEQLGDILIGALERGAYVEFDAIVAFAKNSGVLRLKKAMECFRGRGGRIRICVGIDLDGTSYEALTTLRTLSDELYVAHTESDQTFHTKAYRFLGSPDSLLVVGSNNMTAGGLWTNFETSLELGLSADSSDDMLLQMHVDQYMRSLLSDDSGLVRRIAGQEDVEELLNEGYIDREVGIRIRRRAADSAARKPADGQGRKLFPRGVHAPLPRLGGVQAPPLPVPPAAPKAAPVQEGGAAAAPQADSDQAMWFETRKMTGGSRNILDLSKTALVEKGSPEGTAFKVDEEGVMGGGVLFFGIDPADEDATRDIVINYEGVDYEGNTIKYPVGEKANGTWRLQIKGVSPDGEKITQALGEDALVGKILVFTKVRDDYYYLSVFDGGDQELGEFVEASRIVAHNGGNARSRLMGIL